MVDRFVYDIDAELRVYTHVFIYLIYIFNILFSCPYAQKLLELYE